MERSALTREILHPADCWLSVDRVKDDALTTEWKRWARWRQYQWASSRGHKPGFQPYSGKGDRVFNVGSRLELAYAKKTGANFLTDAARSAVDSRLAYKERYQMLKEDRLWADLLSSMPLCFNLFGDLNANGERAARAVHAWWPEAPAGPVKVRFEHSPGRLNSEFLGNKSAFDVALEINPDSSTGRGIIGVETKYHEHAKVEEKPSEKRLGRYVEVTERSTAFKKNWREELLGTDLQQIWLDHLLVLSMLQHSSKTWTWGRFVLVYPAENPSFASSTERYRAVLNDSTMFEARTIESLLDVRGALEPETVQRLRERYL